MKEIIIKIDENTKNPELAATAEGMVSSDYKERFIAEFVQVKNRYYGLKTMIDKCKLIMDYINAYLLEKENCKFDDLEL